MNGYLEMKVSELRQTWDNYVNAKRVARVKFDRLEAAYKREFGHPPVYEKGVGGHNLFTELFKCKENRNNDFTVEGEPQSLCSMIDDGISLFFDPPLNVKGQCKVIGTILEAAEDEEAKVLVDVDLCDFIRRWKNGGGLLRKGE